MALIAITERHLSGSILLCWFVAAKPSTFCKYFCILCLPLWRGFTTGGSGIVQKGTDRGDLADGSPQWGPGAKQNVKLEYNF